MTSTSVQVPRTRSFSRSPSRVRGLCKPGVSISTSWASSRCTIPRIACRVVCGLDDAMAILLPTRAFVRVDLPALGRPTKQAKPERKPAGTSVRSNGAPRSAPATDLDPLPDLAPRVDVPERDPLAGQVPNDVEVGRVQRRPVSKGDGLQTLGARGHRHRHRDGDGREPQVWQLDAGRGVRPAVGVPDARALPGLRARRSEEHTSELQSRQYLVCRLLLEKKKT